MAVFHLPQVLAHMEAVEVVVEAVVLMRL